MHRRFGALIIGLLAALGCSSPSRSTRGSAAQALTEAIQFEGGLLRTGLIPKTTEADITLTFNDLSLVLSPDDGPGTMSLGVDNPNEADDPVEFTLMQFAGADAHIQIDRPVVEKGADATAIKLKFSLKDDVCERLCDTVFEIKMIQTVQLEGGGVGRQESNTLSLDCSKHGDPKQCTDNERDASGPGAGDGDAASSGDGDAGSNGGNTGRADASTDDSGASALDAGAVSAGPVPQIGPISPASLNAGAAATLSISGIDFEPDAVAYVDGNAMSTSVTRATQLEVIIPASSTANAGSLAVYVQNVASDPSTRSNVLYLQVAPVAGAPLVYDYSPDNGVGGDTIQIIASNLAGQTLTIEDANGTALTPGTLGTISWPTAGSVDTVDVVLPDNIATGPITVTSSLGSYRAKIFSVGLNLTRATGTVASSSTQFNDSNWSTASGADNLLSTSFFTASFDCATLESCTTQPWYQVTFASAQTVTRIAMRGNREYASGYDFIRGTFEVLDANDAVLWQGTYDLPAPDRDLDITLPSPIKNALAVKFTSLVDESVEPGFAELEVFGP